MHRDFKQFNITSGLTQELINFRDYNNDHKTNYYFKVVIANNNTKDCKVSLFNQDINDKSSVTYYYVKNVVIPVGTSLVIKDRFYLPQNPIVIKSESGAIDINMEIQYD
tara:strand:- start:8554 stop:8880 length:327 start_codon:yes stop_codon:yes gene_type:complete